MTDQLKKDLDGSKTPTQALWAAYENSPHAIVTDFLDRKSMEILMLELPKMQQLISTGPACDRETALESIEDLFVTSMKKMAASGTDDAPSRPVQAFGLELAQLLDRAKRELLADDTHANLHCVMDLLTIHANIIATLDSLALNDEQQALVDKIEKLEADAELDS